MRCWWCGAEPVEIHELRTMESNVPVRLIPEWPPGDHPHSERPPTADELAAEAYRLLNQRVS
jgi:hypothetical protein